MTPDSTEPARLPLWRLIAGIGVLVAMTSVLIALAPAYLEDYQLRQYMRSRTRTADIQTTPDEALRADILTRARQLDLPVQPGQVVISHADGKVHVDIKYEVQMDFPLYQVDLHFHPGATSR